MTPKSSSSTLMSRNAVARIVPSSTGTSYVRPVRLSVMVRDSVAVPTPPPLLCCSSVPMRSPRRQSPSFLPAMMTGATCGGPARDPRALGRDDRRRHGGGDEQRRERHHAPRGALAARERLVPTDADEGD